MSEKRRNKGGRNPKLDPAVFRYTVRFSEEEHNRFLSMFEKSGVNAKSVFLKAHFFGQPFKVLTKSDELAHTIQGRIFYSIIPYIIKIGRASCRERV